MNLDWNNSINNIIELLDLKGVLKDIPESELFAYSIIPHWPLQFIPFVPTLFFDSHIVAVNAHEISTYKVILIPTNTDIICIPA